MVAVNLMLPIVNVNCETRRGTVRAPRWSAVLTVQLPAENKDAKTTTGTWKGTRSFP